MRARTLACLIAARVIESSSLWPSTLPSFDYPVLIASRSFSPCTHHPLLFLFLFWLLCLIFPTLCYHHHNSSPPPITGWVSSYLTTLSCSSERRCSRVCEVTASSVSPASLLATAPPPHCCRSPSSSAKLIYFSSLLFFNACFLHPLRKASEKRRCTAHASFCTCFVVWLC